MSKDAYWFEHDSNAHSDPEIKHLRMKHGWAAYGAFWAIVELLRDTTGYKIKHNLLEAICFDLRIENEWVETMFERGLFETDGEFFWSSALCSRMQKWDNAKQKRIDAGRKGGIAKSKNKQSPSNAKAELVVKPGNALARRGEDSTGENKKEGPKPAQKRLSYSEDFSNFWAQWPGKVKGPKSDAYDQWKKTSTLRPGCGTLLSMINAAELRRLSAQRRGEFQPEWPHVHRWLKKRRWEEIEDVQPQTVKMCTLNGIGPMFPLRVPVDQREQKIAELAEKGYKAS